MRKILSIILFVIEVLFLLAVIGLVIFAIYAKSHPAIDSPELVGCLTM